MQNFLLVTPEAGDIVPDTGGVRKIRWKITGTGKRGGVRIIYYFKKQDDEIWLLTIYKKKRDPKFTSTHLEENSRGIKMTERNIAQEILDGIREIKAFKVGEGELKTRTLSDPASPQVIRSKLKLSQVTFADLMGVSLRTVQEWEQGRRQPSGPAKALLRIADQKPEIFLELK